MIKINLKIKNLNNISKKINKLILYYLKRNVGTQ